MGQYGGTRRNCPHRGIAAAHFDNSLQPTLENDNSPSLAHFSRIIRTLSFVTGRVDGLRFCKLSGPPVWLPAADAARDLIRRPSKVTRLGWRDHHHFTGFCIGLRTVAALFVEPGGLPRPRAGACNTSGVATEALFFV